MTNANSVGSELPIVNIDHGSHPTGTAYEGGYPASDQLPFDPCDAMGERFEMDGEQFMIDGDLSGQAIYHRIVDPSVLYHMPWTTFADLLAADALTVRANEEG
jgi:hypothetical protein